MGESFNRIGYQEGKEKHPQIAQKTCPAQELRGNIHRGVGFGGTKMRGHLALFQSNRCKTRPLIVSGGAF